MMVTIFHNPRCTKSRQTLKLLEDRGISPDIVHYLKVPLNEEELKILLGKLDMSPRDFMRKGEAIYKELGLSDPEKPDSELIEAMIKHPILMERPVVIVGEKAVIGRPPENVLDLID